MTPRNLRHGYTTGSCAAAAVKGACQMLRDQGPVEEVQLTLPCGETARFRLQGGRIDEDSASCYVVKDAGDDPDVTHGAEIHAHVKIAFFTEHRLVIQGGTGIGRITKPGLAVPVGEWAINPVPRKMILEVIKEVFALRCVPATLTITVSIPNGEELAKKTLNERLGIVGGLSILGTTGIVKPISTKAWTDTLDAAVSVAVACGARQAILSTGRTSEMAAQRHLEQTLKPMAESFIMMGDHFGYAVRSCAQKGMEGVVVAGQFAKLVKIGCGHEQTHVSASTMDLSTVAGWLAETAGLEHLAEVAARANTARHLLEESGNDQKLVALVCEKAAAQVKRLAPELSATVLMVGYHGEALFYG
ncbi:cobalt-precorrin-5B (C(1))-methyltransferase [Geomonas sp. RF6]|uniref:cobalt-precorrin-5B (C(1))-methyltransferase n=1 Tax=Geomonas sp. RF6 TaxID=2897342 RepID=UPI001E43BE70|nr:cobalt-precorrin-5B (C(1))-methyltransferase [Geomonas sp. RF6]UFS71792.1 cobalt-precorrin-5B (C(1))-methyltransferase [Geomonas sp. RF6]